MDGLRLVRVLRLDVGGVVGCGLVITISFLRLLFGGRGWRGRKPSLIGSMTIISSTLHIPFICSDLPVLGFLTRSEAQTSDALPQLKTHQHQPTIPWLETKNIRSYQLQPHPHISSRKHAKESSTSKEK